MTVTRVVATQLSNSLAEVVWEADVSPVLGFELFREVNEGAAKSLGTVADVIRLFVDPSLTVAGLVVGDSLLYSVVDLDAAISESASPFILRDLDVPFTFGQIDYLYAGAPRYTTVDAVKKALEINDTSLDTELAQAVNAGELQMDVLLNRSFPDTGTNPEIPGVPQSIQVAALSVAIGTFKLRDTIYGSAGTDDWLGSVDVSEQVRRVFQRNPLLMGYKRGWGIG
jgi:hypothetical protein